MKKDNNWWHKYYPTLEVLYTEDQIKKKVKELADRINKDYEGKDLAVVMVYSGCIMFASDLLRQIQLPVEVYGVNVSSYVGTKFSGKITFDKNHLPNCQGMNVLILEDIVEGGHTINTIRTEFEKQQCTSIKICSLLDKPHKRKVTVDVDYVGFTIGDVFALGYGLDVDSKMRNIPIIGFIPQNESL